MGRGISRDGCVSSRALGSYIVRMLGVVRSFLRLVKSCHVLGSRARLSWHSTALTIVWITQLCLERICQAGLPSQEICGVLKLISVVPSVVWQQFVGVSSYASLIKLNLRNLNEVNVGEQVSKMVVVCGRAPTGRICIRYVIYQCALLRMQYVYCTTRAKTWKISRMQQEKIEPNLSHLVQAECIIETKRQNRDEADYPAVIVCKRIFRAA